MVFGCLTILINLQRNYYKMGQCMQTTVTSSRLHPFLGHLNQVLQGKETFYQISFPVANEEEYISWSKNILKLRYCQQVKKYFYLPVRQRFNQSDGLCQGVSRVQLFFSPFYENLKQTLIKNINNRRYFHESYLWHLVYLLLKTIKYYHKREKPMSSLRFENVLVFNDGTLKIIPQDIIPNLDIASTLYAELEIQEEHPAFRRLGASQNLPELQIAGIICLSVAELLHPALSFDKQTNRWTSLGDATRREALKNCEKRYSSLLIDTLSQLTQRGKDQGKKIDALCRRFEPFQNQIIAKRELGLNHMGYSSVQSIKTSYCMDNKTVISNNNSNMLRLSSVENESTSPSNRSLKHQKQEDEVIEEEDDYLNIL